MKVTTISYKQKFPTGSFLNCDIGFEASIGENENPEQALSTLQKLAESFHKSSFPHLYTESGKPITIEQADEVPVVQKTNEDSKLSATQRILQQINESSDEKVLQSFKLLVRNNSELQEAYNLRLKQLSK